MRTGVRGSGRRLALRSRRGRYREEGGAGGAGADGLAGDGLLGGGGGAADADEGSRLGIDGGFPNAGGLPVMNRE